MTEEEENLFGRRDSNLPVAIDIGASSIKVLQLKEDENSIKLHKIGVAPTPYGAVKDGLIVDTKAVSQTIQKLLSANQIKEKNCVSSFPGQQVIARLVKLPPMAESEIKQAISYQAEKYIPFPLDTVVIDTHYLGEVVEQDAKKTAVLLVAAQKEAVNSYITTFSEAGLWLRSLDIAPFLSIRGALEGGIFLSDPLSYEETILYVDIGASSCDISVINKGILRFARIIPIAGTNLTKAIATTMNLNIDEAEKMKKEFAAAYIDEEDKISAVDLTTTKQLVNIITPILSSIVNEIQRSLAYYESKFRRARISKLVLCGGTSKLRNFSKYLTREIGLNVVCPHPFSNIQVDNSLISPDYISAVEGLFSVSCGLSLRDISQVKAEKFLKQVCLDNNFEFGSSRATAGAFV